MNFSLTDDQRALQEGARAFADAELAPHAAEWDATAHFPIETLRKAGEAGFMGLYVPEEHGGLGLPRLDSSIILEQLATGCISTTAYITIHNMVGWMIASFATDSCREQWVPAMVAGDKLGSYCLTEPGSGSDAASLRTTAVRDGDHYVLNGTKRYITNGPEADLFTVMARTDPYNKGAGGISAFIVEGNTPGLIRGPADNKMGQKGAHTCDIIFDNCRVPAENIIGGKEGQGFKTAMKVLDRGRLHISAVCVGVAERLVEESLRYTMERKQFGAPLAEHQLVQAMLADSKTEAYAGKTMVMDAARRKDDGENVSTLASCCKLFCAEMVGRVADRAVQVHGGAGYMSEYAVERFYRDVRLFRIYEGTTQIQQLVIARNMVREAS